MEYRADEIRGRLDDSGIEWIEADRILFGRSHALRTANWLSWTETSGLRRMRYTTLNPGDLPGEAAALSAPAPP